MALPAASSKCEEWIALIKILARSFSSRAATTYQVVKKSYDWTNGCRKLSIVINPFMMFDRDYRPHLLREPDEKGALMCFGLLVWVLLVIGRIRSLCALYTAALSGVVVQYALLHCGAWVAESLTAAPELAPAEGRASVGSQAPEPAAGGDRTTERILETVEEPAAAAPARTPSLASVASALAFCSVPVAACALFLRLVSKAPVAAAALLPAAWCTLLAACSLLPPAAHDCERAFVLLPCGVLYTFLALLFTV